MKRKYTIAIIIILAIVLLLALSKEISGQRGQESASQAILFYGDGCPHCENVDEYLTANDVRSRVSFQELEVYNNKSNAQLLAKKAQACGLDSSQGIGVPFFYDGSQCYMGDQPIIDYFQQN